MVEAVIRALIGLALLVLCVFLVVWVLGTLGIVIPAMVLHILYVIAVLIGILYLWRLFGGMISGPWFPPRA